MSAYINIRRAMRRNEVELLAYVRSQGGLIGIGLLTDSHRNAFMRLQDARQIRYNRRQGWYTLVRGARPVTAVR